VVAIVGPTAAGKSAVALRAAERLGGEIVAVDAFTVYRGMDVGTAKPSPADRRRVPHHMVDVLEPEAECTVRWFQEAARAAVDDILGRGRPALLVGGSGLYFRAVVDPLSFPPTDPGLRRELEGRYAGDPAGAHAALTVVDPAAAARMDPANLRRAVRALEVHALTGRAFSDWYRAWDSHRARYPRLEVVGIDPGAALLNSTLDARVDAMLAGGLVDECRRLAGRDLSRSARQAIGYAEIFDALAGRFPLAEAARRIKNRTRRYAARQRRWFRADPRVRWYSPSQADAALT
jgi:tRNA dimethylallyltransferase